MNYAKYFSDHVVHATLAEIDKLIDRITWEQPEYKNVDELLKVKYVVDYFRKLLKIANPFITSPAALDNINANLVNASTHLNSFLSSPAAGLQNAVGSIDGALSYSNQIVPKTFSAKTIVEIDSVEIFQKLQKSMAAEIEYYSKKEQEFEEKSKVALAQISTAQTNLEATKQRVDAYITNLQTSFNTSESERQTQSAAAIASAKADIKKLIQDETGDHNELRADLEQKADDVLAEMEKKKEQASRLLQIITTTGFAGNYSKNADAEKKSADIMRWVSIAIFAVISGFAIWILFTFESNSSNWQNTLVKILASSLLTALATYTARESSKHRKLEQRYRKMELELSSLDAFIESLPVTERNTIKAEITKRLFSQEEIDRTLVDKKNEDDTSPSSILQTTLKMLDDTLKNLSKRQ